MQNQAVPLLTNFGSHVDEDREGAYVTPSCGEAFD
jgi:hypothetical protein